MAHPVAGPETEETAFHRRWFVHVYTSSGAAHVHEPPVKPRPRDHVGDPGRLGEHSLPIPPRGRSEAESTPQRRRTATVAGSHHVVNVMVMSLGPGVACAGGSRARRSGGSRGGWAGDKAYLRWVANEFVALADSQDHESASQRRK